MFLEEDHPGMTTIVPNDGSLPSRTWPFLVNADLAWAAPAE
jgi:hypothetical protein